MERTGTFINTYERDQIEQDLIRRGFIEIDEQQQLSQRQYKKSEPSGAQSNFEGDTVYRIDWIE